MSHKSIFRTAMIAVVFLTLGSTWGAGEGEEAGYAVVAAAEGSDVPFTSVLLSGRNEDGILTWETPIEARVGLSSGRVFVDQSAARVVLTLVNTTQQLSQVTFSLHNAGGQLIEETAIQLSGAQQQIHRLIELFPGVPPGFVGTCSFESDQPLVLSALEEEVNGHDELIYTTIPLVSLDPSDDTWGAAIPQITAGQVDAITQMTTRLVMLNPHQQTLRGRLQILSADHNPAPAQGAETIGSEFIYEIPPDGVLTHDLTATDPLSSAYAVLDPEAGSTPPVAYAVLGLERQGQTLSKTAVPARRWTRHARTFVGFEQALVGLAIGNPGDVAQEVFLEARTDSGKPVETGSVLLGPGERLVKFVGELFPAFDRDQITTVDVRGEEFFFLGSLKVTFNERSDLLLTGLPWADLDQPTQVTSAVLAQLGIGNEEPGNVERQFLFLTQEGKGSQGQIDFFKADGEKLLLPMGGGMANHYRFWMAADSPLQLAVNPIGPPVITRVSPEMVSLKGGETITITGSNFTEDSTVVMAKTVIQNVQFIDSTQLVITTLPTDVGRSNLTVQTRYGLAQSPILVDSGLATELQPGEITTVAGGSTHAGDGGPGSTARLSFPSDLYIDRWGNLYINDWSAHRIRRVDSTTGIITTVAGFGRFGIGGDGGPAVAAGVHYPTGVASDAEGNLFIADSRSNRIRRVDSITGQITTLAGSLESGFAGDGGPAHAAKLNALGAIAVDAVGNVYIGANQRVRAIDTSTGIITTIAGNGESCPSCRECSTRPPGAPSLSCPPEGFICEPCEIGEGGPATEAVIGSTGKLRLDGKGNLVIVASAPRTVLNQPSVAIRAINLATGIITTLAGGGDEPISSQNGQQAGDLRLERVRDLAFDSLGNLYLAHYERDLVGSQLQRKTRLLKIEASSGELSQLAELDDRVHSLVVHEDRWLYYAVTGFVYKFDLESGTKVVWAGGDVSIGDGDLAIAARTSFPEIVKIDRHDNLYYIEGSNQIRRFQAVGTIQTIWQAEEHCGLADFAAESGQLFVSETCSDNGIQYPKILRTGTLQQNSDVLYAGLPGIWADHYGLVLGQNSTLYFSSRYLDTVHRTSLNTGQIDWVAGGGEGCWGQDGSLTREQLCNPQHLTADDSGNLYAIEENRIRKIDLAEQTITTIAGNGQSGSTGDGGPALSTSIRPSGLAVDARGNVFFSDWTSHRVYRVNPLTGIIEVYAGRGGCLTRGDGGAAVDADICRPEGLAVDSAGNLFVADREKSMIRAIKASGK